MEIVIEDPMGRTQERTGAAVVSREGRVCKEESEESAARARMLLNSIGRWGPGWPVVRQRTVSTPTRESALTYSI